MKLDSITDLLGMRRVRLLWIDAQGAEMQVLQGADKVLEIVDFLYIEVADEALYAGGAVAGDVISFLESRGFVVHSEYRSRNWPHPGNILLERRTGDGPLSI